MENGPFSTENRGNSNTIRIFDKAGAETTREDIVQERTTPLLSEQPSAVSLDETDHTPINPAIAYCVCFWNNDQCGRFRFVLPSFE